MQIQRLEIYGYGKWVDATFDLKEDIQLFYGLNEAGKSTLMSFIHSILFGFPTRNSVLLRYEPRESSRYGGKIIATDARFGEVIIERIHGKVTGNVTVTLEDGTTGTDELLASIMYGLEREMFQNIFSFSLTDIENVHQLDKNQLSRYLLNIGAHGTEYYLELVDQFQKDANKLYRPSGRVLELNEQLTLLETQEQRLADLEKRNERYLGLIEANSSQTEEIQAFDKEQKHLEKDLADLVEMKKKWPIYEEIQQLETEISKVTLPPLKEDGRYLLDEYKRNLNDLNDQLYEVEKNQQAQKQTFAQPELMARYDENKETVDTLENQLPEIIEALRDFEAINEKRATTQKELIQVEEDLEIENHPSYPTRFSEEEKTMAENWQTLADQTLEKQQGLAEAIQRTENELGLKNQQLDQYEAMMWDNQELQEIKAELTTERTEEKTPNKMLPLISGLVGLFFLGGFFFVETPLNGFLALFGVLAVIITFVLLKRTPTEKAQANVVLQKEYERQLVYKEDWQQTLGEVDALQANYQSQLKKQTDLSSKEQTLQMKWQNLLEEHRLPKHLPLVRMVFIFEKVDELHQLLENDKDQSHQLAQIKEFLEEMTAPIHAIVEVEENMSMDQKVTIFRRYLQQLKAALGQEEEKLNQLQALKQKAKQLENTRTATKEKIQNLLETTGVNTEDEFVALYKEKDALDQKKSRLRFLKENTTPLEANTNWPTKEEMAAAEAKANQQLDELAFEKDKVIRQQANTQLAIENLEKDGTYTEELQVFENQKATAQRLADEWVSYKLAAGMIKKTLAQVTQGRFQEIIADAEQYFYLLTDGEYERIVFKEEELFVQQKSGQLVSVRVLSRGTSEPLYVAIRLAYIKNTQDMMELPIIIDDPFVNFDRTRQQNMYQLLAELSKDVQIIYFTFDPTAKQYFTDKQTTIL